MEPADPALEIGRMLDEGAMPEEGLRVKLADGLVRKPVDAAVPMG